ncbi:MAG: hypothetical protein ACUVRV_12260 [Cyanobacteriota bacterium]
MHHIIYQRTRLPPDFDPDWAGMQLSITPHPSGDQSVFVFICF